jgi:DNA-binding winged helix-turn-helix (wHTH) protein/TolB-like protein
MMFRFGIFEFDSAGGELRKNGRVVGLEPQPAKALALLLSKGGEIASREELRDAVWGADTHVDFDRGLAYCVSQIRAALGDSGDNPRFIQTIPKRGFRFIAPLSSDRSPSAAPPIAPILPMPPMQVPRGPWWFQLLSIGVALGVIAVVGYLGATRQPITPLVQPVFIGVSIFDNETGLAEHDRLIAGLSDLVVERLSKLDAERIAVIGNAHALRQPRNIRNLQALKTGGLRLDYVLLGQLQKGQDGLRFITHFIRLSDEAHLKANRLTMPGGGVEGLERAVVEEFERAVRDHVLRRPAN